GAAGKRPDGPDDFFPAAPVCNQDRGGIDAVGGILKLSAELGGHIVDGTVDVCLVSNGNENRGTFERNSRHTELGLSSTSFFMLVFKMECLRAASGRTGTPDRPLPHDPI